MLTPIDVDDSKIHDKIVFCREDFTKKSPKVARKPIIETGTVNYKYLFIY